MNAEVDELAKPKCIKCRVGNHVECLWADRPLDCSCVCDWLEADMTEHFPSLRGNE